MTDEIKFCLACGRPLIDMNKNWDGELADFCNDKCRQRKERESRPKNRRKYGAAGYIYDGQL